ncbi:MAG: DUF1735 domain-containing protein [Niabella sp.]
MKIKAIIRLLLITIIIASVSCSKTKFVDGNDVPGAYVTLSAGGFTETATIDTSGFQKIRLGAAVPIPGNLKKSLTLKVALDPAALEKYNTEKAANYKIFPAEYIRLAPANFHKLK